MSGSGPSRPEAMNQGKPEVRDGSLAWRQAEADRRPSAPPAAPTRPRNLVRDPALVRRVIAAVERC